MLDFFLIFLHVRFGGRKESRWRKLYGACDAVIDATIASGKRTMKTQHACPVARHRGQWPDGYRYIHYRCLNKIER